MVKLKRHDMRDLVKMLLQVLRGFVNNCTHRGENKAFGLQQIGSHHSQISLRTLCGAGE